MRSNKGQIELIGLVVIVILITLGILFMAKFSLTEDTTKKVIAREFLASSAMGALMKTNAVCKYTDSYGDKKVEPLFIQNELLEDCALYRNTDSEYSCSGQHSCDFLNQTLNTLLNNTLGKNRLNKHYEFRSFLMQNQQEINLIYITDEDGRGCRRKNTDSSGAFPLPTDAGQVISILKLCD
tara:strand:- start:225 stop:770 length:546 start_codon:yes stop_codon:yes gene_type:complete